MSAPVFLIQGLSGLTANSVIRVDGDEGRHAATVKRLRPSEIVHLCDGQGTRAVAQVTAVGKDWVDAIVEHVMYESAPELQVMVVQAIAKGDRADLALEIMTEVGVTHIIPWSASRCVAKWDSSEKHLDKWSRTVRESTKQSRGSWIPQVSALHSTNDVGTLIKQVDVAFVLHEGASETMVSHTLPLRGKALLIVGPEGGITHEERDTFVQAGAHLVRLGKSVLRTSTAGGVAASVLLSNSVDWQ